ncbi:hypothetical protein GYMLUDRAFT_83412 [Collybiopsis luxurians FD-317 M1]|uniref:Unplaced genomic scaffold GYMLUscaffold_14, whole genome shotgun sequence n=1 Tax=Collybiopsis luxurians FD-317 M1 TaxID=944289 RepID=A0A0D0D416_9AGAR|nr:hypothetical protein GYMLUDRAFT_83412 [Collybiopsis luxurians FD-317 M1]
MARTKHQHITNAYRCRLYDSGTGRDLVLDGSSAEVTIADVHASITLSQKFTNPFNSTISTVYSFGLMADAAIYGFEMVKQDGTRVEGVVKEKDEAMKEYASALRKGHTASLGQVETADVFSISVGNILPSEAVTIHLRYLQPLMDDEKKDQIKFIFPRTYAQRYGAAPTVNTALGTTAHQPFQMNVIVQQAGAIKSISCPSGHPISLELGLPDGMTAPNETSHFASVSLTDPTGFLTQDVVLVVTAADLDAPRGFVELHPSPNHETAALALTFVPRFNLPDAPGGMEYVFLVDRSGSMEGQNIQLVREALIVLLRGLPTVGTTFNIFSFGSRTTKLWEASRAYNQATLEEASNHVDAMDADYGGTEIASALELVFSSLTKPLVRPVAVLLLTDGSAWDVSRCVSHTRTAVTSLPVPNDPSSFIRIFTVGIGNGASTDTCDSIARAGAGMSVYVKQGEPVVGKCARLVRAARTPPIKDITVLWTGEEPNEAAQGSDDDFEILDSPEKENTAEESGTTAPALTLNLFDNDLAMAEGSSTGPPPALNPILPPPPALQVAPVVVSNLFPGTRMQIYAIVNGKGDSLPSSIKMKGVVATTRTSVELVIPLSQLLSSPFNSMLTSSSHSRPDSFPPPFLHTLAAKALITDRQDGKHAFPSDISESFKDNSELQEAYLKKEIVRLGTTYQLASKHTSFIAVDYRDEDTEPALIPVSGTSNFGGAATAVSARRSTGGKAARKQMARMTNGMRGRQRAMARPPGRVLRSAASAPGSSGASAAQVESSVDDEEEEETDQVTSGSVAWTAPESWAVQSESTSSDLEVNTPPKKKKKLASMAAASTMLDSDRLTAIARMQQFNGGLSLSADLLVLLGIHDTLTEVEEKLAAVGVTQNVAATVLAWSWMEKSGGEEALDLIEKAKEWIKGEVGEGTTVEEIQRKVLNAVTLNL